MVVSAEDLAELVALERATSDLEDLVRLHPLATWRAWDRSPPRTSQLRALALLAAYRTVLIFGGNRTGKTELALAIVVAIVLGSDHPDARAFWALHGLDPDALRPDGSCVFPRGPGKGWIVALTSEASIEYHRSRIVRLLPRTGPTHPSSTKSSCWAGWNLTGVGDARIEICVPGYDPADPMQRSSIVFKSDEPGPDAMQGSKCRIVHHDEETVKWGDRTWEECDARLTDEDGWHVMTNTFLQGETWAWHRWAAPREPEAPGGKLEEGAAVAWIHAPDNPYLPPDAEKRLGRNPALAQARLYGRAVTLEGKVYPHFDRAVHVVPTVELPRDWPRFRSIDFGTRHPFACLWAAVARSRLDLPDGRYIPDGAIVVYREHYQAEWTLRQHARRIYELEGYTWSPEDPETGRPAGWTATADTESIEMTWADPEDAQQLLALIADHDIDAVPAEKAVAAGIDNVADALLPLDVDGLPRLFFLDCCPHTIREHDGYVWWEGGRTSRDRDPVERPKSKSDHTCDCVRYLVRGIRLQW